MGFTPVHPGMGSALARPGEGNALGSFHIPAWVLWTCIPVRALHKRTPVLALRAHPCRGSAQGKVDVGRLGRAPARAKKNPISSPILTADASWHFPPGREERPASPKGVMGLMNLARFVSVHPSLGSAQTFPHPAHARLGSGNALGFLSLIHISEPTRPY